MNHKLRFRNEPFEFDGEIQEAWETTDRALEFTDHEVHSGTNRHVPKTIVRYKTDLDAPNAGGNLNFLFNGGSNEAKIIFNTYLSYRGKYPDLDKAKFLRRLRSAVAAWDSAAEVQVKSIYGDFNTRIKLRFELNLANDPKNANKRTEVHPTGSRSAWFMIWDKNRETVVWDMNVFIGTSRNTLVHELGHVWGLLDEYDTRWIEKKFSPGHVGTGSPLIQDKNAIMNEGYAGAMGDSAEFRGRYFKHFGRAILSAFWGLKNYVIPIQHNGKVVSRSVQGRIVLLKKDIAGSAPYPTDKLPFNPRYTAIEVAKV